MYVYYKYTYKPTYNYICTYVQYFINGYTEYIYACSDIRTYISISVVVSYRHFYLQAVHIHLLVMSTYEVPTADPAGLRAIH